MRAVRWLAVVFALAAAGLAYLLALPYGPSRETFVDIPSGTGTAAIAARLQAAGIIRSRFAFSVWRRVKGGTLRAGEYRFDRSATLSEVYAHLERGDVYTISLTIPEGYNIFDIASEVEKRGLGRADAFLAAEQSNARLIADLSPHAASLEGYLFPDTYRFGRHATAASMLAAMVKRFRAEASELGLLPPPGIRDAKNVYDVAATVTLASMIEKEVRVEGERPLVAGVFGNRLRANMPLATDPTVIYAALLDGRWRGTIYRSDLQAESPYNTYRHPGLPPGPIANPGAAALKAAMHPAETDYLYFVADAEGHSRFAVSLKEHEQQVQAYRAAAAAGR